LLDGALLSGTLFCRALFCGTLLRGTLFRRTLFRGTLLRGALFRGELFRSTLFRGTLFCDARLGRRCRRWLSDRLVHCWRTRVHRWCWLGRDLRGSGRDGWRVHERRR
jgi:hypothetical protein